MPVLTVRFLAIAGGAAFVLAALQVACGAPPEHDIHLPGGAPVAAVSLPVGGGFNGALTPTVSVADVRCQIYRRTVSPTCPDDASLARAYWPELQRTRDVVFVGLRTRPSCFHMNVEYLAEEHKVLFHCHHAGPCRRRKRHGPWRGGPPPRPRRRTWPAARGAAPRPRRSNRPTRRSTTAPRRSARSTTPRTA